MFETKMKLSFVSVLSSLFILLTLIFGVLITGAGAAETVIPGGIVTYTDLVPTVNPMTWDIDDWNWKHGYDTGFYMEHLLMGDLQKGPRGSKKTSFQNNAWVPPDIMTGELLEKWEVKKKPMQIILHLRKGMMWQEKPGS